MNNIKSHDSQDSKNLEVTSQRQRLARFFIIHSMCMAWLIYADEMVSLIRSLLELLRFNEIMRKSENNL